MEISGAKNAAVAIIPAALLVEGVCRIENIPQISDTDMLLTILAELGAKVSYINKTTIEIDCSNARYQDAPYELMRKIRAAPRPPCPAAATSACAPSTSTSRA